MYTVQLHIALIRMKIDIDTVFAKKIWLVHRKWVQYNKKMLTISWNLFYLPRGTFFASTVYLQHYYV